MNVGLLGRAAMLVPARGIKCAPFGGLLAEVRVVRAVRLSPCGCHKCSKVIWQVRRRRSACSEPEHLVEVKTMQRES